LAQVSFIMATTSSIAALTLVGVLLLVASPSVSAWKRGRATFYGNEPWYWSIHHGSEWHFWLLLLLLLLLLLQRLLMGPAVCRPLLSQQWPLLISLCCTMYMLHMP
jgi:hypothetical protein